MTIGVSFWALLAFLSILLEHPSHAQTSVAPGDTGSIEFPLQNSPSSDADLQDAVLQIDSPPQFIIKSASILGPHTIPPTTTYTLVVEYEIAANAAEGPFTVTLKPRSPTTNDISVTVSPDLTTLDTPVSFTVYIPASECGTKDSNGHEVGQIASTDTVRPWATDNGLGVCGMQLSGPGGALPAHPIPGPWPDNQYAETNGYRDLAPGGYTNKVTFCDGREMSCGFIVNPGSYEGYATITAAGPDGNAVGGANIYDIRRLKGEVMRIRAMPDSSIQDSEFSGAVLTVGGSEYPFYRACNQGNCWVEALTGYIPAASMGFTARNVGENASFGHTFNISVEVGPYPSWVTFGAALNLLNPGPTSVSGEIELPEVGNPRAGGCDSSRQCCASAPAAVHSSQGTFASAPQGKTGSGPQCHFQGSALAFVDPIGLEFRYHPAADSGTMENLSTLAIYSYEGANWEKTSLTDQSVEVENDGTVVLRASTTHTAVYGAFFDNPEHLPDAAAPVLSNPQVSDNGLQWHTPDYLLNGATVWASVFVSDPPAGIQVVSGLSANTAAVPLTAVTGTLSLVHFDEGSGAIAADSSGNGRSANPTRTTWTTGRFGSALLFDPANSAYASFSNPGQFNASAFTVGVWVKPSTDQITGTIFSNLNATYGYYIGISDGYPFADTRAGTAYRVTSQHRIGASGWHYVVATYDGASLSLYVDGAIQGRIPAQLGYATNNPLLGQSSLGGYYFSGAMDEFRFLNRAESSDDVLVEYQRGYGAQYSVDGGSSWQPVPLANIAYDAVDGSPGPNTLMVSGLHLAESTTSNKILFYAMDMVGHLSSTTIAVMIRPADTVSPVLSSAQVSSDGSQWHAPAALLEGATAWAKATITDPSFGIQRVAGLSANTVAVPLTAVTGTLSLVHFDEGSGAVAADSSGNGRSANPTRTTWTTGRFGSAILLDPANSAYASFNNPGQFNASAFTIGLWIKPSADQITGTIFSNLNSNAGYGYYFGISNGYPFVDTRAVGNVYRVNSSVRINSTDWHYVVATYDGATLSLYVDGASQGSIPAQLGYAANNALLGQSSLGGSYFSGAMDEFRFLNRAESSDDILAEYQRGYGAQYSVDGGNSWQPVPLTNIAYDAVDGGPGPSTLMASGLRLAESTSSNKILFYAQDMVGHLSSATISVMTSPADITPPAFSNVEISNNGADWYANGTVLPNQQVNLRLDVQDPVVGIARTRGLSVMTDPEPLTAVTGTLSLVHFDEGSGTLAADSSGNGRSANPTRTTWTTGRFGSAILLDPANSAYASFNNPGQFNASAFTIGLWIKPSADQITGTIFSNLNSNAGYGYYFGISNGYPFVDTRAVGNVYRVNSSVRINSTDWHYVVAAYDGATLSLYVDGASQGSIPAQLSYAANNALLGQSSLGGYFFSGAMDEFRFLNRAEGAADILAEYRRGYGAMVSVDGGATWSQVSLSSVAYEEAVQGSPTVHKLSIGNLALSTTPAMNQVKVFAMDAVENTRTAIYPVDVGPDTVSPPAPVMVSTRAEANNGIYLGWQGGVGEPADTYVMYRETYSITTPLGLTPIQTGLKTTYYVDNPIQEALYYYALTSIDFQGNQSVLSDVLAAYSDHTAPQIQIVSPKSGEKYIVGRDTITVSFTVTDNLAVNPTTAAVLMQIADLGEPRGALPDAVVVQSGQMIMPPGLDDGIWELRVTASDCVLNSSTAYGGAFEVVGDTLPPTTTLSLGPRSFAGPMNYISSTSYVVLSAVDDLVESGDGAGVGVYRTSYSVDSDAFMLYTGTFSVIVPGYHSIAFFSVDVRGNPEALKIANIAVDTAPPSTVMGIAGASLTDAYGRLFMGATSQVVLTSTDPVSDNVNSGLKTTLVLIDRTPQTCGFVPGYELPIGSTAPVGSCGNPCYITPFSLQKGTHTLNYWSRDNVGNEEPLRTTSFTVGMPPPAVADLFASTTTLYDKTALTWSVPQISTNEPQITVFAVQSSTSADIVWSTSAAQTMLSRVMVMGTRPTIKIYSMPGLKQYFRLWSMSDAGAWSGPSNTADATMPIAPPGGVVVASGTAATSPLASYSYTPSSNTMNTPEKIVVDKDGSVWISDTYFHRVLRFDPPFTAGMNAALVLGQPSSKSGGYGTTIDRMAWPKGLAFGSSGELYVADSSNGRVLIFRPPFYNGMPASASLLAPSSPNGIAIAANGDVYVMGSSYIYKYRPPFSGYNISAIQSGGDATSNGIVIAPDGTFLVGGDSYARVFIYNSQNLNLTSYNTTLGGIRTLANNILDVKYDQLGNFWACSSKGDVVRYKTPLYSGILPEARVAGATSGLAFDQSGNLWSSDGGGIMYAASSLFRPSITSMTVTWGDNKNPPGTQYEAQLSTSSNFTGQLYEAGFLSSTSCVFTGLVPNTQYYARSRARDSLGNYTAYIGLGSELTQPAVPPGAVTDLSASALPYPGRVQLNWTAPQFERGVISTGAFVIQYSTDVLVSWSTASAQVVISTANIASGSARSYITTLSPDTQYSFNLWTLDEFGAWSGPSNLASTRTMPLSPPSSITDLSAANGAVANQVALGWTDINVAGMPQTHLYVVQYSTDSPIAWSTSAAQISIRADSLVKQQHMIAKILLTPNNRYSLRVWSRDELGIWSGPSNIVEMILPAAIPGGVVVASGTAATSPLAGNSWTPSATVMNTPEKIAIDKEGSVWISDSYFHRVLKFEPPFSPGMSAALVLGQPDFTSGGYSTTTNRMAWPKGLAFGSGGELYVVDSSNGRVLIFRPPFYSGMPASASLRTPSSPDGVVVAKDAAVYVTGGHVYKFVPPFSGYDIPATIEGGSGYTVFGADIAPDGTVLMAGDGSARVFTIDSQYLNLLTFDLFLGGISFFGNILDVRFDPAGNLWACSSRGDVARYSMPLYSGIAPDARVAGNTRGLAFDSSGNMWSSDGGGVMYAASALFQPQVTSMTVVWTRSGNPEGTEYQAQLSTRTDFAQAVDSAWITSSSYAFSGLEPATTYYTRVKSRNFIGAETEYAALGSGPTAPDSIAPGAVTDLYASRPTTHSLLLSWTAPGDNDYSRTIADAEIRLHHSISPTGFSTSAAQHMFASQNLVPGTTLSYVMDGLDAGTTYYVAVFTRDSKGNWSTPSIVAAGRTHSLATSSDLVASLASPASTAWVAPVSTESNTVAYNAAVYQQAVQPILNSFYEFSAGLNLAEPAQIAFYFNPTGVDLNALSIYTFNGVSWDSASIVDQHVTMLADDRALIEGEVLHTSLYVPMIADDLPPTTALQIEGSSWTLEGSLFASSGSHIVLSAEDRTPMGGVRAGVEWTRYSLDGSSEAVYSQPFFPGEGRHTAMYFSRDRLGNREEPREKTFFVDLSAPDVSLAFDQPVSTAAVGYVVLASSVALRLTIEDPLKDGARAGLSEVLFKLDGATQSVLFSPGDAAAQPVERILPPGVHVVELAASDRVGNASYTNIKIAVGDALAPVTTLVVGMPQAAMPDGMIVGSTSTPLILSAADYSDTEIPSGVMSMKYRISIGTATGEFSAYQSPFHMVGDDGPRTIEYFAVDYAGNAERVRMAIVGLDATPPKTGLFVAGGMQYPGQDAGSFYTSADTFIKLISIDPVAGGVAAGTAQTSWQDNGGAFAEYSSTFSLSAGRHVLAYQSRDNVDNLEVLRSTTVLVDATGPDVQIAYGQPEYISVDGSRYLSPASVLTLSAQDPALDADTPGSGVQRIEYELDHGGYKADASTLSITAGLHGLSYHAVDRVGNLGAVSTAALLSDALAPISRLEIGSPKLVLQDGTVFVGAATELAVLSDDQAIEVQTAGPVQTVPGSGVKGVFRRIAPAVDFSTERGTFTLTEGVKTVEFYAKDNVENAEALKSATLRVDASAPDADLASDQTLIPGPDGFTVLSPTATITLSVQDPEAAGARSGLGSAEWELDGVITQFSFTPGDPSAQAVKLLNAGQHIVTVRSADWLGNAVSKTWRLNLIGSQDTVPPQVAIFSPCPGAVGICRVYEGLVKVAGTATDANLRSWKLEYSQGASFILISSGTTTDGTLGMWNTASLNGNRTLKLTAEDVTGNVSSTSVELYIGDPARTLVLGSKKTFNHPHAVAVAGGKLYVADTNADRVAVFDQGGSLLVSYGNKNTKEPYFDKPKAVDADGAGNVYVADTRHHRIVKLSPAGAILLEIGDVRTNKNGTKSFFSGTANGQFKQPSGVAVGPEGRIYVSDTGNRRVQVFNTQGVFQRAITLPNTDQDLDRDDEDNDEFAPVGLDVDAAGKVYVADAKGRRALVFDPNGALTLGISGMFRRPEGVSVSPDGSCILVSDRKLDKIFKFDFKGSLTLDFGEHGEIKDGKSLPAELVFNKPIGLALSENGTLYVADRNNERIQGFGLPGGQMLIASGEAGGIYRAASTGESAIAVEPKFARSTLLKENGGSITRDDKAAVLIPPAALPEDSEITIAQAQEDSKRKDGLGRKLLAEASEAVEYGPEGTRFTVPVTITLPYLAEAAAEDQLKIHYWNPEKEEWEALDSVVDKENKVVSAKTSHFSLYQVLAPAASLRAAADPEAAFTFRELYVFPNPARAGAKPVIHLAVGRADQVVIKIYNVAGQPVHEAVLDGAPQVIDAQYAYEYAWDGHIPSGVYFYTVEAKKGGQGSIRRTGKMAVVR